ncbi:MAG: Trk system potassium transporter TrkA [Dorea sp.]|nr:Trk system potassium transporter TrkA [Dorea sp.]
MKIVVIGNGKVGYKLTSQLSEENYDVTLIDKDSENLKVANNALDILSICGNGADMEVQKQAGVPDADMVIACTPYDELNMLACLIAKRLGAKHTIARVRNPVYYEQIHELRADLRLSMSINPEHAAANEIARVLLLPQADRVETFMKDRVELVEFQIRKGSPLADKSLIENYRNLQKPVLVCVVKRGEEIYIPNGSFVLHEGDRVHMVATHKDLQSYFKSAGLDSHIKNVLICGGGVVCYYLAKQLLDHGLQVKIVEEKLSRCEELCDLFPKATVINGDISDQQLLEEEGLTNADAVVTLTGLDEANLVMAMYAQSRGVKKVVAKVNDDGRANMARGLGIDSLVSVKGITADHILQYVRATNNSLGEDKIETCYKLLDGKVEAVEFKISKTSAYLGKPLKDLKVKANHLVACVGRGKEIIIPNGRTTFEVDDSVVIVTKDRSLKEFKDIFA